MAERFFYSHARKLSASAKLRLSHKIHFARSPFGPSGGSIHKSSIYLGRTAETDKILADTQDRVTSMATAVEVAQTYAVLHRKGEALQWLEYAYEARAPYMLSINRHPDFALLRAEQQFQNLVRRIGWPQCRIPSSPSRPRSERLGQQPGGVNGG